MRFIHLRKPKLTKDNSLTTIPKGISPNGGATIGFSVIEPGCYAIEIARCNDKDLFCKKIGRAICEGRMKKRDKPLIIEEEFNSTHTQTVLNFVFRTSLLLKEEYVYWT